jgi:hypothetical protein
MRSFSLNVYGQIGLLALIGLAAKNALLIANSRRLSSVAAAVHVRLHLFWLRPFVDHRAAGHQQVRTDDHGIGFDSRQQATLREFREQHFQRSLQATLSSGPDYR